MSKDNPCLYKRPSNAPTHLSAYAEYSCNPVPLPCTSYPVLEKQPFAALKVLKVQGWRKSIESVMQEKEIMKEKENETEREEKQGRNDRKEDKFKEKV